MNHIIQMNNNFTACVHHQHAHMISDGRASGQPQRCSVQSQTISLHQTLFQVIDITNLCFVHASLHNIRNLITYKPIFMKLNDTFDAILFDNIPLYYYIFSVSTFTKQCSNINQVRWVKFTLSHVYRSSLNQTAKTALKYVDFLTKLQTKISCWLLFYGSRYIHCVSEKQNT